MIVKKRIELVKLLRHLSLPLIGVECGVAEGRFSRELFDAGMDKMYLVDIWEKVPFIKGCASFDQKWHMDNLARVQYEMFHEIKDNRCILLKGFSYKMAEEIPDNTVGLVYIDGDHTYEGCRSDIDAFLPKLVPGGVMAFHDYGDSSYGVCNAVHDFTKGHGIVVIEEDGKPENIGAYFIKP